MSNHIECTACGTKDTMYFVGIVRIPVVLDPDDAVCAVWDWDMAETEDSGYYFYECSVCGFRSTGMANDFVKSNKETVNG